MDIYKVLVCRFTGSENYCYVERLIVENYYDHYCEIDFTSNVATDIFAVGITAKAEPRQQTAKISPKI